MGRYTAFRIFPAALPKYLCDGIVQDATGEAGQAAAGFWPADHWLSGLLWHFAVLANKDLWRYNVSTSQGVQFATYETKGFYDWHKDELDEPFGEGAPEPWRGLARKLSVSANLSDPADYEGGELLMKDTSGNTIQNRELAAQLGQQGTVVVFPSYILHAVRPVTSGVKHSLVTWVLGPPFV